MIGLWLFVQVALCGEVSLEQVLHHLDKHPTWIAADNTITIGEAKVRQAQNPFTPTLIGQSSEYLNKYPREIQSHHLQWQSQSGIQVSGGWEQGRGDFPSYDDRYTKSSGELHLQAMIPLLDGLLINTERTVLQNAILDIDIQKWNQYQQQLDLMYAASVQYWKWYKAYQLQIIAETNLQLAQNRQQLLERKLEIGSTSKLYVIDNQRELLERQQQLITATQENHNQLRKLEYYFRNRDGTMMTLQDDSYPVVNVEHLLQSTDTAVDLNRILQRPDMAVLTVVLQQIANEQQLIKAKKRPKVNLMLDTYAPLKSDNYPNEHYMGLKYEFAPLMPYEQGKMAELQAKANTIAQYQIKVQDTAQQEILIIANNIHQLKQQLQQQEEILTLAQEALRLENIRFESGGSNLLDLMKRENNLLKAQSTQIKIQSDLLSEWAHWKQANAILSESIQRSPP